MIKSRLRTRIPRLDTGTEISRNFDLDDNYRKSKDSNCIHVNGFPNDLYEECVRESRIPGNLKLTNEQNGNVIKAIEELCNLEKNYAKRFLTVLLELGKLMIQKQICIQVQLLLNNFKNSVRYVALFHYKLSKRMAKAAQYTHNMLNGNGSDIKSVSENIADVFVRCKPEFLRYAPLIVQSNNLKSIITSMERNSVYQSEFEEIESLLRIELNPTGDICHPIDISQLLSLPFQHICRYELVIRCILKEVEQCLKLQPNNNFLKSFSVSLKHAVDSTHDINNYINYYIKDMEKLETIRKIQEDIASDMLLGATHGTLKLDILVYYKKRHRHRYKRCRLLCFQLKMFVFQIEEISSGFKEKFAFRCKTVNQVEYTYVEAINVTEKMVLKSEKECSKLSVIILNNHFTENRTESFIIKAASVEDREYIERKIQKLIQKQLVKPCDQHLTHDYELWSPPDCINIIHPEAPPICGLCNMYLFGTIFPGYKCRTCDKYYHHKCFTDEKVHPDFTDDEAENDIKSYEDNKSKEKNRDNEQKNLLLHHAEIPRNFNSLNPSSCTVELRETNISLVERCYELSSSKESRNIRSRGRIINFCPNINFLPNCKIRAINSLNEEVSAAKEITSIIQQETDHGIILEDDELNQTAQCVIDENFYSRFPFFVGMMSRENAYNHLINERNGTFLLRATKRGQLKFSVKTNMEVVNTSIASSNEIFHFKVFEIEGIGWSDGDDVYDTLEDFVSNNHHQNPLYQLKYPYFREKENPENEKFEETKDIAPENYKSYLDEDGDDDGYDDD